MFNWESEKCFCTVKLLHPSCKKLKNISTIGVKHTIHPNWVHVVHIQMLLLECTRGQEGQRRGWKAITGRACLDIPSFFFVSYKCRRRLWLHFISHLPVCLQDPHTPPWWVIPDSSAVHIRVTCVSVSGSLDDVSVAGKVVSGYRIRDGKWSLIGRQSPQLPQVRFHIRSQLKTETFRVKGTTCHIISSSLFRLGLGTSSVCFFTIDKGEKCQKKRPKKFVSTIKCPVFQNNPVLTVAWSVPYGIPVQALVSPQEQQLQRTICLHRIRWGTVWSVGSAQSPTHSHCSYVGKAEEGLMVLSQSCELLLFSGLLLSVCTVFFPVLLPSPLFPPHFLPMPTLHQPHQPCPVPRVPQPSAPSLLPCFITSLPPPELLRPFLHLHLIPASV